MKIWSFIFLLLLFVFFEHTECFSRTYFTKKNHFKWLGFKYDTDYQTGAAKIGICAPKGLNVNSTYLKLVPYVSLHGTRGKKLKTAFKLRFTGDFIKCYEASFSFPAKRPWIPFNSNNEKWCLALMKKRFLIKDKMLTDSLGFYLPYPPRYQRVSQRNLTNQELYQSEIDDELKPSVIMKEWENVNALLALGANPISSLSSALLHWKDESQVLPLFDHVPESFDKSQLQDILSKAVYYDYPQVAKKLFELGAKLDDSIISSIILNRSLGTGKVAEILGQSPIPEKDLEKCLERAVLLGNKNIIKALLNGGVSPKGISDDMFNNKFISSDDFKIAEWMVEKGWRFHDSDNVLLNLMSYNLDYHRFKVLVKAGANLRLNNDEIMNNLISSGNAERIAWFLETDQYKKWEKDFIVSKFNKMHSNVKIMLWGNTLVVKDSAGQLQIPLIDNYS